MAFEDHVRTDALSSRYVYVDHERIVFDDTEMLAKDVTGFAYGGIIEEKMGIQRKPYYIIRMRDSSGDQMKIRLFSSSFHPEHDPQSECYRIVQEIWQACGNRLLNETVSAISRGFHEQFKDVTLSQKGVELCEQNFFGKADPKLYDWNDVTAAVHEGVLTIQAISQPKARTSFELPNEMNAHILREIFGRKATQPGFLDLLTGKIKI